MSGVNSGPNHRRAVRPITPFVLLLILASCFVLATSRTQAAVWGGFVDQSTNLLTRTFSFTGTTNPAAGDSNENYYDGDMADWTAMAGWIVP